MDSANRYSYWYFNSFFLVSFTKEKICIDTNRSEKSSSTFSNDRIHSWVFIQPQIITAFALNNKTITNAIAKWLENFLIAIPDSKALKHFNTFLNQNIN